MTEVTIYHNPRCSKSREALRLLRENSVEPRIVEYLKEPPSSAELIAILDKLDMPPRDLIRRKEAPYRDLNLDDASLGRDALVAAMAAHPVLIERPVVVKGDRAVLGRPPERVLEIV